MADGEIFHPDGPQADQDGLDCRQLEVLSALSEEENATYSFQGLRRNSACIKRCFHALSTGWKNKI
jgi:hypothetical protein